MALKLVALTNTHSLDPPHTLALLGQPQDEAKHAHLFVDAFLRFRLARDDACRCGRELVRVPDRGRIPVRAEDSVHGDLADEHPLRLDVRVNLLDRFAHEVELVQHGFDDWEERRRRGNPRGTLDRCCGCCFLLSKRWAYYAHFADWFLGLSFEKTAWEC